MTGAPAGRDQPQGRGAARKLAPPAWIAAIGAAIVALLASAPVASAQDEFVPEIPLTDRFAVGARSPGMGGTGIAAADDLAALHLNPAALALVRRTEVSFTMARRGLDVDATVDGRTQSSGLTKLRFNAFGFAYPFKTYRGSLVIAAAVSRPKVLDKDVRRILPGPDASEFEFERGGPIDWRAGLAVMVTPNVTLGGSFALLTGDEERTFSRSVGEETITVRDEASILGWTGSLGILAASGDLLRFGAVLHLPERYDFEGTQTVTETNGGDETTETIPFIDEVDLPFSFGAGAALTLAGLIITADLRTTDWREIDFAGLLRVGGRDAYRSVTTWHLGAEWYLPWAPIRVRAGYQIDRIPYLLLPDFTGQASVVFAEIDPDRAFWSAGAGFLISDHLTADLGFMRGDFRRATEIYAEEVTETRLLVSLGYRI